MPDDHELDYAIMAHQRRLIDSRQLAEACFLWADDRSVPMAEFLERQGWIDREGRARLDAEADRSGWTMAGAAPASLGSAFAAPVDSGLAVLAMHGDTGAGHTGMSSEFRLDDKTGATVVRSPVPMSPIPKAANLASYMPLPISLADVPATEVMEAATAASVALGETVDMTSNGAGRGPAASASLSDQPTVGMTGNGGGPPGGGTTGEMHETIAESRGHVIVNPMARGGSETRDHYTLTKLHARGGIGQVWLARDTTLGREVALKELRPEQGSNRFASSRFLDEARITGQLEHPGIVPVYELTKGPGGEHPFYTMRFIRGRTLGDAITAYHKARAKGEAGPLDRAALLDAFIDVCNAVHYAHSRGVIHRDLKGQNVVLGDYGEVMVLDWGLAKVIGREDEPAERERPILHEGGRDATIDGQIQGTPAYMAPEQAEGRVADIEFRTDVYGLAAILYEILAGRPPFTGKTSIEIVKRVRHEPPARPRSIDPAVPPALEAICLKGLQKLPADRYADAGALAHDVRRWLADEPVSVYREPLGVRVARWARRHRTAVSSAAALVLVGLGALGITTVLVRRERDQARVQRQVARLAVDDMYSKVASQWLEDRLDPLQKEFLGKALAYYESFAAQDAADPIARQERGRAYLRMGDVLRKLGHHEQADAAYRDAMGVLGDLARAEPGVADHRRYLAMAGARLAGSLRQRGKYAEAEPLYREAIDLDAALASAEPGAGHGLEEARAWRGLGELLRDTGKAKDAEQAFVRARDLLDPIVGAAGEAVEPRQELAAVLDGLGRALQEQNRAGEAEPAFRKASDLLERLVAEGPGVPGFRDGLAKVDNSLGLLLRDRNDREAAIASLQREIHLQERLTEDFPDRPEYRRALARGLTNLGILTEDGPDPLAAEPIYRRALPMNEALAAEFPDVVLIRRDLARSRHNLAKLLASKAEYGEAERLLRAAESDYDALAREFPETPNHRLSLASTRLNLGLLLGETRRRPQAEATYAQALEGLDKLVADDPRNPDYARVGAKCLQFMGNMMAAGNKRPEAEEAYRRATELLDVAVAGEGPDRVADQIALADCLSSRGDNLREGKLPGADPVFRRAVDTALALVTEYPRDPRCRQRLGVALVNQGEFFVAEDRKEEADAAFGKSGDLYAGLTEENPARADFRNEYGYVLGDLAQLRLRQGRPADAEATLERAAVAGRSALDLKPKGVGYRAALRGHLATLAGVRLDRGDHAGAARAAEELARVAAESNGSRAQAARLLAGATKLAAADANLPEADREAVAGAYADRAIALVREAIERNEPRSEQLLTDASLDPLKARDAFRTLPYFVAARSKAGADAPKPAANP